MRLLDVNVLVNAFNAGGPGHAGHLAFLASVLEGPEPFAVSGLVLSGFIRIVTHPRIFGEPATTEEALAFTSAVRSSPHFVPIEPGSQHWDLFADLCRRASARANLVPDAFLAALAIESGCELVTWDRGFGRFPGLRWMQPPR